MRRTLLGLVLVGGCAGAEAVAPRHDIVCTSAITPTTFHMVSGSDTVLLVNRYTVPHHEADTVVVAGPPELLVISSHGGRCTTLADSLIIYSAVKPIS